MADQYWSGYSCPGRNLCSDDPSASVRVPGMALGVRAPALHAVRTRRRSSTEISCASHRTAASQHGALNAGGTNRNAVALLHPLQNHPLLLLRERMQILH